MIYGTPDFKQLLFDMIRNNKRHDLYAETVEEYRCMKPHIYGDLPVELLNKTRPREPQDVKQYRLDNYEPTTKSTASKALSILQKIFNPWFSEIKWTTTSTNGKKLAEYTLEYYPEFNSIIKYLSETGVKRMVADANGVMAVRTFIHPETELQQVNPVIVMYGSPAIWWYDMDCWVIHTKVENNNLGELHYFTYYDKNFVADFTAQVISTNEVITDEKFIYPTQFNEIPVWFLQGDSETTDEGLNYYVSFFEPALPSWNLAIRHESDLFAAYIAHLHPVKVEVVEDCDFVHDDQRCDLGRIKYADGKVKNCPSCHGSGKKNATGAYGVHYVTHDKLKDGTGAQMQPVQYVTVPTEPTKMLEIRAEKMHSKGLEALNMDVVQKVGENQSGIAKTIDRGELHDFLYKISSVVYDTHLTNIYYFFNKYMFGVQDSNPNRKLDDNLPEISKPVKFDISSTEEMIDSYSVAKKAGADSEYLRQKMMSIAAKEFANNPDLREEILLSIELDPLPGLSPTDADALLMSGVISKRDCILHFNISKFIQEASFDDKFKALSTQDKLAELYKLVDQFIKENKITLTEPALPIVTTASLRAN